jgi:hypothetical protein
MHRAAHTVFVISALYYLSKRETGTFGSVMHFLGDKAFAYSVERFIHFLPKSDWFRATVVDGGFSEDDLGFSLKDVLSSYHDRFFPPRFALTHDRTSLSWYAQRMDAMRMMTDTEKLNFFPGLYRSVRRKILRGTSEKRAEHAKKFGRKKLSEYMHMVSMWKVSKLLADVMGERIEEQLFG